MTAMPPDIDELPNLPPMDTRAPMPRVEASEGALTLTYRRADGPRVLIAFKAPLVHRFGAPTADGVTRYSLYALGLRRGAAHIVAHSPWIDAIRRASWPRPRDNEPFADLQHYVWTFGELRFECLAQDYEVSGVN